MANELITIENMNPALVFVPNGLDKILEQVEREALADAQVLDVSTTTGREGIRTLSFKVAKSKTALDKMGKALGAEYRDKIAVINSERKNGIERMQVLQDKIRQPLTDFENKEKDRVAAHEQAIVNIEALGTFEFEPTLEQVQERLDKLQNTPPREWQEFGIRADILINSVYKSLTEKIAALKKAAADQAELERLQREEQERIQKEELQRQKEREEAAAAKAKAAAELKAKEAAEAERKAVAERAEKAKKEAAERIEKQRQEKLAAQKRADDAEKAKKESERKAKEAEREAAKKAEAEKLAAVQKEKDRQAAETKRVADEQAKREADTKHKAKINNEVLNALVVAGLNADAAKLAVTVIAEGKIPHMSIKY